MPINRYHSGSVVIWSPFDLFGTLGAKAQNVNKHYTREKLGRLFGGVPGPGL